MFKRLKLATKISLGFGVVLAALILVGGMGYSRINEVHTAVLDLSGTHVPLLKAIDEIDAAKTHYMGLHIATAQHIVAPNTLSKWGIG